MDRDFLEEIRELESEAVTRLEQARADSQMKRQAARQEAARMIDQAYRTAAENRQKKMDEAEARYHDIVTRASNPPDPQGAGFPEEQLNAASAVLAERIISILEHR